MYGDLTDLEDVKKKLNSVSPSFCMAKWMHCTIHLLNGRTHSCYLPPTHSIPLAEISNNPSALHNTQHKKEQRKKMLNGERPKECQICWSVEDLPGNQISDRIIRGTESWTRDYFDQVRQMPWDGDIHPTYVEVSFSSTCNFKCSYCSPHVSTKWHEEIRQHGPYQLTSLYQNVNALRLQGLMPIENEDENPYIEAFWKWWPDLYPGLRVFRITGGEPLLSKQTFRILDWIEEHPNPQLSLDINSNLGVPDKILARFYDQVERIYEGKKVRSLAVHTSLDNFGEKAEYIRHGLNFPIFERNVNEYLSRLPYASLAFMSTFNALSVVGYQDFLDWIFELRHNYHNGKRFVHLDIPHLVGPEHLAVKVLTPDYTEKVAKLIKYMSSRLGTSNDQVAFRKIEVSKLERIHEWMSQPMPVADKQRSQIDFYLFFSEHDRRRGTNFLKAFPEMDEFWSHCKDLALGK